MENFAVIGDAGYFLPDDEIFLNALQLRKIEVARFASDTLNGYEKNSSQAPRHCWLIARMLKFADDNSLSTTVLDIGGYIGIFGIPIGQLLKTTGSVDTQVHIFEPTPLCKCIEKSIDVNELQGLVVAHHAAVSMRSGVTGYYAKQGRKISGRLFPFQGAKKLYDVATITIDDFLRQHGTPDLLVAKVDTEGHEVAVFQGAAETVERSPMIVFLELWPWRRGESIRAQTYADFLGSHFHLFDIGSSKVPRGFRRVVAKHLPLFLDEVARRDSGTTDLLCISKSLGSAAQLKRWLMREVSSPSSPLAPSATTERT